MDRGAHIHRCDFQVHTPRDPNWSGSVPVTVDERKTYARKFIAACRTKGLDAVAITDHHDMLFVPYIRQAALEETHEDGSDLDPHERITVYPGMELTLGVPCQALLILDADLPDDQLGVVLEALAITPVPDSEPQQPPVSVLSHTNLLSDVHKELDKREWLRGRYILLPHVTDKGHQTLMRSHMGPKYAEMPCVGGYVDGDFEAKTGEGNRKIFAGLDSNYGNRRIAVFQTSDSRAETFDDLGRHSTWVKWAEPTAEALRQACLAQESRISLEPPPLPTTSLTKLRVSNSKFMGPIDLEFNAQYNAIIGGRGTGKSTCLEYIRWALCDQPIQPTGDEELADHAQRREALIADTLATVGATVDVEFLVNDVPHTVRRSSTSGELVLKVGAEDFAPATEANIRALLPMNAYSQKQLSSVGVRKEELTRFLTAPLQETLELKRQSLEKLAGDIRQNYAALQQRRTVERAIARDDLQLQSLTQQADTLRASLGAVSEEDRATLSQKPLQDEAEEALSEWDRTASAASDAATEFEAEIARLQVGLDASLEHLPNTHDLTGVRAEVALLLTDLKTHAEAAVSRSTELRAPESQYNAGRNALSAKRTEFTARYEAAKDRSSAHETRLQQLSELEGRQRAIRETLGEQRAELAQLGDPAATHVELRKQWRTSHIERHQLLEEQCKALRAASDELIDAKLSRAAGLVDLTERFRGAIARSNVRSNKIEALLAAVVEAEDPFALWEVVLEELEALSQFEAGEEASSTLPECPQLKGNGFTDSDLQKMGTRLTPDGWLELALATIEDQPRFRYQVRESEFIDFERASAGQQATALLRVLLNQGGPPLLIDQPEDDLDSQVVVEVVERLWSAKVSRQLIFTSHNANLVVNGDAELVVCCDYREATDHSGGRIKLRGAIDVEEVREEITTVMEGGERAFKLRKEKYGF